MRGNDGQIIGIEARSVLSWSVYRQHLNRWFFAHRRFESSIADALDRGAAGRQLFLEPLEPAVEMIDAVDHGLAFGGETGDKPAIPRAAQVRCQSQAHRANFGDAIDGRGFRRRD